VTKPGSDLDGRRRGLWGRIQGEAERIGAKLPVIDSLLTATAEIHCLTLATRNVADFDRCGATVFNPWGA
jgi:predicted nucleic acid-binding protein